MRRQQVTLLVFGLAALVLGLPVANAEMPSRARPIGVVELFTSQGCSSCPKADAALEVLSRRDDVIAVAFHVDYWNYLGWADTLSAKENTRRQYGYAKTLGNANVYTPQIVLNGSVDIKSTMPETILARLADLRDKEWFAAIPVDATLSTKELAITIGPGQGKADVVIAYFNRNTVVEIAKGENTGKRIAYRNAVTSLETVGVWEGKALTLKLPAAMLKKPDDAGCAILLQSHDSEGNPGRILGAAAL